MFIGSISDESLSVFFSSAFINAGIKTSKAESLVSYPALITFSMVYLFSSLKTLTALMPRKFSPSGAMYAG